MKGTLAVTGNADADDLLNTDPFALVMGMLLDQQVPMEWAFVAPAMLRERLEGRLDVAEIAAMDPDELDAVFRQPRALHRYPSAMAKRVHALAQHVVDEYGGDAAALWTTAPNGRELYRRLKALPGYGEEKSRIFMALLAKRFGVAPKGWKEHAGPFADRTPRSVADVDSPDSLARVREYKKARKAEGKGKTD